MSMAQDIGLQCNRLARTVENESGDIGLLRTARALKRNHRELTRMLWSRTQVEGASPEVVRVRLALAHLVARLRIRAKP